MLTWSSEDDHLRLRVTVCRLLLGATVCVPGDPFDSQFGLSSTDGRPNWMSKPDPGRYVMSLRNGTPREMG
jgi:hypothetical protein